MHHFQIKPIHLVLLVIAISLAFSLLNVVSPAYHAQDSEPWPSIQPLTSREINGLKIYTAENCMTCHTQYVGDHQVDRVWGKRLSLVSDYYYSKKSETLFQASSSLLGNRRIGPDLTNIGQRQPGQEWHLLHLYNPRIVVSESIMPAYPWLFDEIPEAEIKLEDVIVRVPEKYRRNKDKRIVASTEALDLVAYLQTLSQASPLNTEPETPGIITNDEKEGSPAILPTFAPDGAELYLQNCAPCHQPDGKGLTGTFPPLAGSPIVNLENPETLIQIILQGYDARQEYGMMPGFSQVLSNEEITAIANHERTSWGNKAPHIYLDEVQNVREFILQLEE